LIGNLPAKLLFDQFQGRVRYSIRKKAHHAAMIDGAFALEARRAFHIFAHHAG
jgi:hypothetical protein